jgi:outer membrane receptor protein involved in Fe transport
MRGSGPAPRGLGALPTLWVAIALLLPAGAVAQEPPPGGQGIDLDELLVITATLHEQSVMDAPVAITVITAADIAARGYRGLAEILADVPGFNEVSDINEETVATRGVFASTTNKTLFLINGHRMNDLLLGRYNVDQYLGVEAIERIELIRGPVAPLYGTGALVGVVNIITKKGREVAGTRLHYQGGTLGHEAALTWGRLIGDYDLLFNFTFRDQGGDRIGQPESKDVVPPGEPPQGRRPGQVYWRRYPENFSAILDVRTEDTRFTVRGAHFQRVTPRGATGSFYDYPSEVVPPTYTENDFFVDWRRSFTFGGGANKVTVNPALHHFSYAEQSFLTFGVNRQPPLGSRSATVSEMNNYQLKLTYERTFLESLSGTAGFDGLLSHMYRNDQLAIAGAQAQLTPHGYTPPGRWLLAGLFAQLVYAPTRQLSVTAGGRFDTFDGAADPRVTPRLAVVWRPRESLALKLLYGESYLAPEWAHRRSREPQFLGNAGLRPEVFRGSDAIVMYQGQGLALTGDLYLNQVQDLINSVPNAEGAGGSYQNTGTSIYYGLDATVEAEPASWLRLGGGYSYIRSTRPDVAAARVRPLVEGREILDVPRHTVRYGLRLAGGDRLTASLWGRFTGAHRTLDPILHPPPGPAFARQPAVWLFDASVTYRWRGLQLQVVVNNLFDAYYERGGTVPRPLPRRGRVVVGGVANRL